jgi:bacteriocin biosynthesis cyclodehydratase domain-containing protein
MLALLDGTRPWAEVVALHTAQGFDVARTDHLVRALERSGALDDAALEPRALRAVNDEQRGPLLDAVIAWDQAHPEPGAGLSMLRRRQSRWIEVDGEGALAQRITAILERSGLGHASAARRTPDVVPAVPPSASEQPSPSGRKARSAAKGRKQPATTVSDEVATMRALRDRRLAPPPETPDLVVVVGLCSSARARRLVRAGVPHLIVDAIDGAGLVGPLVVPGRTACGDCVEADRSVGDPARAWVALDAPDAIGPLDPVTLEAVAALAAAQALQQVEQRTRPATINGLLLVPHDGVVPERLPVAPAPRCGCTWEVSPPTVAPTMAG